MCICPVCNKTILRGQLVRVVCTCVYTQPTVDGYYLDFQEQESMEHYDCKVTPWYERWWLKYKTRKMFRGLND